MSLRLIDSKYVLYIFIKAGINIFQPLRDVFMYRRFVHAKLFCGAAYGGLVFHDILPKPCGPGVDDILGHMGTPRFLCDNTYEEKDAF